MPITTSAEFVAWFRSVAPYINAFRGRTFVIAFGGEVVADGKFVELTHDFNLLASLGIIKSHSRPHVSDDNPFSEAQFKTLKYLHDFPGSFATVQDARAFCDGFFAEYNHVFRHSGIGWHTPASVHFGTAAAIDDARQVTLNTAYAAHPERFARRPVPPQIPTQSWINQPQPELQNT